MTNSNEIELACLRKDVADWKQRAEKLERENESLIAQEVGQAMDCSRCTRELEGKLSLLLSAVDRVLEEVEDHSDYGATALCDLRIVYQEVSK